MSFPMIRLAFDRHARTLPAFLGLRGLVRLDGLGWFRNTSVVRRNLTAGLAMMLGLAGLVLAAFFVQAPYQTATHFQDDLDHLEACSRYRDGSMDAKSFFWSCHNGHVVPLWRAWYYLQWRGGGCRPSRWHRSITLAHALGAFFLVLTLRVFFRSGWSAWIAGGLWAGSAVVGYENPLILITASHHTWAMTLLLASCALSVRVGSARTRGAMFAWSIVSSLAFLGCGLMMGSFLILAPVPLALALFSAPANEASPQKLAQRVRCLALTWGMPLLWLTVLQLVVIIPAWDHMPLQAPPMSQNLHDRPAVWLAAISLVDAGARLFGLSLPVDLIGRTYWLMPVVLGMLVLMALPGLLTGLGQRAGRASIKKAQVRPKSWMSKLLASLGLVHHWLLDDASRRRLVGVGIMAGGMLLFATMVFLLRPNIPDLLLLVWGRYRYATTLGSAVVLAGAIDGVLHLWALGQPVWMPRPNRWIRAGLPAVMFVAVLMGSMSFLVYQRHVACLTRHDFDGVTKTFLRWHNVYRTLLKEWSRSGKPIALPNREIHLPVLPGRFIQHPRLARYVAYTFPKGLPGVTIQPVHWMTPSDWHRLKRRLDARRHWPRAFDRSLPTPMPALPTPSRPTGP